MIKFINHLDFVYIYTLMIFTLQNKTLSTSLKLKVSRLGSDNTLSQSSITKRMQVQHAMAHIAC